MLNRFMSKVEMIPFHTCWEWIGGVDKDGYGVFWKDGINRRATQISYELFVAPFPSGMLACHTCDNPSCVNPRHIWPGTHLDNHRDRNQKNRQARGETSGNAKLTEKQAIEISEKYRWLTNGSAKLAGEYGVTPNVIVGIIKGRIWKHVTKRETEIVPGKPIKRKIVEVKTWQSKRGDKSNRGADVLLECGHWTGPRQRGYKEVQFRTHIFYKKCIVGGEE